MLSDEDIVRRIRTIRRSSQIDRQAQRAQSLASIATASGISRMQLYRIERGEPLGPRTRHELSRVLQAVT